MRSVSRRRVSKKTFRLTVNFTPEQGERLARFADEHHVALAWAVNRIIDNYLLKHEQLTATPSAPSERKIPEVA